MINKVLVVGKNSMLAKNFLKKVFTNSYLKIDSCNHNDIPIELHNYDVIVNFSFNPILYSDQYKEEYDQDLIIARLIKDHKNTRLVMLSSRQVYGIHRELNFFKETDIDLNSEITTYGLNKIKCENNVKDCIDDNSRVLICRSSNIFGNKIGGRNFVGIALNSLVSKGIIKLNLNQNVIKDFLPIDMHSKILESLIINNVAGTYNVGSGVKISLGDLCSHFIKGYRSGSIEDTNIINDQFVLDITKINNRIDMNISSEEILSYALNIGKKMRESKNAL